MSHNLPRRKCFHIFVVLYYVKLEDYSKEQNPFYGTFVSMRTVSLSRLNLQSPFPNLHTNKENKLCNVCSWTFLRLLLHLVLAASAVDEGEVRYPLIKQIS
jgi:hypothetical protein